MVIVGRFSSASDAQVACGLLQSHGIEAIVAEAEMAQMAWQTVGALGGVRVLVHRQDEPQAKRLLAEIESANTDDREVHDELLDEVVDVGPESAREATLLAARETAAARIWRVAVVGTLFWPIQFYTAKLLLDFWFTPGPRVPARARMRLVLATVFALLGVALTTILAIQIRRA